MPSSLLQGYIRNKRVDARSFIEGARELEDVERQVCVRGSMKRCSFRSPPMYDCYCGLLTTDVQVHSLPRWRGQQVFQDEKGNWYHCTEQMAEVCPYRDGTPKPRPEPKKRLSCSACGKSHISATALMICQTRYIIHTQYSQPWVPEGTTESLYNPDPPEWSHRYSTTFRTWIWPTLAGWIAHRDGNHCQDCGVHGEAIIGKTTYGGDLRPTMEVHHIIPHAHGGGDHPKNLKLVCQNCHKKYNEQFNGEIISKKAQERKINQIRKTSKVLESFGAAP